MRPTLMFVLPSVDAMGGSIRVTIELANKLIDNFDIVLVGRTGKANPFYKLDSRVDIELLSLDGMRLRQQVVRARKPLSSLFRQYRPGLVCGVGTYETLLCLTPAHIHSIPCLFWDHGALINQWDEIPFRVIRALDSFFSKRTIVLTQSSKADYETLLHIPSHKIYVIPNWISSDIQISAKEYMASSRRLLWAGRFDREKGIDNLLEIATKVLPACPDWTLDICGSSVQDDPIDIEALLQESGISEQVQVWGKVEDMTPRFNSCAIVVLTSYREGLPLILLEGLGFKRPLISFDVSTGPSDIIYDGINGFLISPFNCDEYANKLISMMNDSTMRLRMSAASAEIIPKFSEKAILGLWLELITDILRQPNNLTCGTPK